MLLLSNKGLFSAFTASDDDLIPSRSQASSRQVGADRTGGRRSGDAAPVAAAGQTTRGVTSTSPAVLSWLALLSGGREGWGNQRHYSVGM